MDFAHFLVKISQVKVKLTFPNAHAINKAGGSHYERRFFRRKRLFLFRIKLRCSRSFCKKERTCKQTVKRVIRACIYLYLYFLVSIETADCSLTKSTRVMLTKKRKFNCKWEKRKSRDQLCYLTSFQHTSSKKKIFKNALNGKWLCVG